MVNIDVPAVVSQFLSELTTFDLVVELVQNDLDAGATRTEISFLDDRIECVGNGAAIDSKGWKRLEVILGAGTKVEAKANGIGSKNHGLKSAFLFGDQIIVQSGGHRTDLTVRGDLERPHLFYPATWPRIADPDAPPTGVRITVPFRADRIDVPERNPLTPLMSTEKALIVEDAVSRAADRFICASAPGKPWSYTLVIATSERVLTFRYACAKSSRTGLWQRTCTLATNGRRPITVARRLCYPFRLELHPDDQAKVPRLFRRGTGLVGEISWLTGDRSRPVPQDGGYRYPIAYPREHVSSGLGFDISGPFISGRARHTISDDARNALITRAGQLAFVELMRNRLLPQFGPEALVLAASAQRQDHEVEERIAEALLDGQAYGVLAEQRTGRVTGDVRPALPTETILAIPTYAGERIVPRLARIASAVGQVLHPRTPQAFVAAAVRLARAGSGNLRLYSEVDATEDILVCPPAEGSEAFNVWLARCGHLIAELELGRSNASLPPDFLKALPGRAYLPTSKGTAARWNNVRRAGSTPPQVRGVKAPALLHQVLGKAALLREGHCKVALFDLDDYLSRVKFESTAASARNSFFKWLRNGHTLLKPRTLATIGTYPIWPSAGGTYHALDYYCLPTAQYLRDVLAEVRDVPDASLISFPGLRRSSTGSLRLRKTPTIVELEAWHQKAMSDAEAAYNAENGQVAAVITRTEAVLVKLRKDGYPIAEIAADHRSLSRAGTLHDVSELHVETPAVAACQLLDEDLAHGAPAGLLEHLGAKGSASPAAIVRALRGLPRIEALFSRLAAYADRGLDLGNLTEEKILLAAGALRAPCTLCFRSSIDWWGKWKTPLEEVPSIPEHVALLEKVGVVRASLREDWSRGFFDWLGTQPADVQQAHLPQVIRHWNERKAGPGRWAEKTSDQKCVPVVDRKGRFELQTLKVATSSRGWTYLPDFEELNKHVLDDTAKLRLAVLEVRGVEGSIVDVLRKAGIRSLRDQAGDPIRTELVSAIDEAPELDTELALVKSRASDLTKRLARSDVDTTLLRHKWRHLLTELKGVRTARKLTAIYRVFGREYARSTHSGVDPATHQVCVTLGPEQRMRFYSALARHLFEPGSSELYAYGLMVAVHSERQADLFAALATEAGDEFQLEPTPDAPSMGHSGSGSGTANTAPEPEPLAPITNPTYLNGPERGRRRSPLGTGTAARRNSLEEEEHKLQLKQNHYAWHCQACLGAMDVATATPPGTYVFLAQQRKALIEAHHVRHLQNEGGLGGENLLILCQYHHRLLGDAISRDAVLTALTKPARATRQFPLGGGDGSETREYEGLVAVLELPTTPFRSPLFFTPEHATAWLRGKPGKKRKVALAPVADAEG